jgi:glycosyltransferase involved in cell wall biosynthesis
MKVLMVGRRKSIAFDELKKYWGEVIFSSPPRIPLKKYDLIIAQEPTLRIGPIAYLTAKICRAKFIVEVHGGYIEGWLKGVQKTVSVFILKSADFVRAVNNNIANQLRRISIKKILVIPSVYVRTDILKLMKNHTQREKIVLYAGRIAPEKNLPLLIQSFKYIIREERTAKLLIIGEGPEIAKLTRLIKEYNLGGAVTLLDKWLSLDELAIYYNEAAIFVLTSLYEGGPRAIFEAGACGTPFISTPVGILPEVVNDGECGYFLNNPNPKELAEKILLLLDQPDLRQKMGETFRRIIIEKFEWSKAIRRYAEAYIKVLEEDKT